ncbi:hypothetical protein JOY44_25920 (plasmid) [Phormidium sp. CLA17]|uniref:hypothetical protein n=1 Tax=Leptolyngbya sp. Cla-17 TaxID=2803751 RepID=UPI0014912C08|nr:hypothetical protein [Leptolyngbya sp. Cla-17]MBM0744959.1 hypothetical protein [Leptolyngbya sp. Cla-17]
MVHGLSGQGKTCNSLEEIVMTLVLPEWQHDVLSLAHALKLASQTNESIVE